jgi:hypothetical protein
MLSIISGMIKKMSSRCSTIALVERPIQVHAALALADRQSRCSTIAHA